MARVELGAENYESINTLNGYPSAGLGISLSPDANAIETSGLIKAKLNSSSSIYLLDIKLFIHVTIHRLLKSPLNKSSLLCLKLWCWSSLSCISFTKLARYTYSNHYCTYCDLRYLCCVVFDWYEY